MLSLPQRTSKFLSIQSSFGEILLFRGEKVVLRIPRGEKPTDIYIRLQDGSTYLSQTGSSLYLLKACFSFLKLYLPKPRQDHDNTALFPAKINFTSTNDLQAETLLQRALEREGEIGQELLASRQILYSV